MHNLVLRLIGIALIGIPLGIYVCGVTVFTPYFNYKYANTHGFVDWLTFGELKAEGQAFAWPYFIFNQANPVLKTSFSHELAAIEYHNKQVAIAKKYGGVVPAGATATGTASTSDWEAIISYNKLALFEAEQADIEQMNNLVARFGGHFRDEFITGLRIVLANSQSATSASADSYLYGQQLMNRFGDWYLANRDAISREITGSR